MRNTIKGKLCDSARESQALTQLIRVRYNRFSATNLY